MKASMKQKRKTKTRVYSATSGGKSLSQKKIVVNPSRIFSWYNRKPPPNFRSSPVRNPAAIRPSNVRFVFRPTCIFIMGHSLSSVLFQAASRHSVRNRTLRSIKESTQLRSLFHVHRTVVRASGRRGTCLIMSVATSKISKCI